MGHARPRFDINSGKERAVDIHRRSFLVGAVGLLGVRGADPVAQDEVAEGQDTAEEEEEEIVFRMVPVGRVEKEDDAARIRIFAPYSDALLGLEGWSHINVLYWFDRNDVPQRRRILRVHPRGDAKNPLTGVFACRAPVRPNLIALSVCRILSVEGSVVTIDGIDAFDGTPVVDLKPVVPSEVKLADVRVPEWTNRGR